MKKVRETAWLQTVVRWGLAVAGVAAAYFVRREMVLHLGFQLPPFITFYPIVMLVAVAGGLWPGLLATVLCSLAARYLIFPSGGHSAVTSPSDLAALAVFFGMGIFTSMVIDRYREAAAARTKEAVEKSEEKVRAEAEYRQLALDAGGLGTWEFQPKTRRVKVDENCRKLFRFVPDEGDAYDMLAGRIHRDDRDRVSAAIEKTALGQDDALWGLEYRVVWPDGSIHWLTTHGRAYKDANAGEEGQSAARLVGVSMDITDRKLVEEVRAADRAKLDAALGSMTDAVFITDPRGQFVQFNDAFAAFHRFPNKAECAKSVAEFREFLEISLLDGTIVSPEMWSVPRALRGETGTNVEYSLRSKDTGETWLGSYSFAPLRGSQDEIIGAVVVARDITERKRTERQLRQSLEQLKMFVEHAPASLAMFDREMRYVSASQRWRSDYGLGERTLTGVSHYEIFPEINEVWKEAHGRGLAGEVLRKESDSFIRADGTQQWVTWEIRPWLEATGKVGGIVIFSEDITRRKVAEQELRDHQDQYRRLFDSMDEGFCIVEVLFDPQGKAVDYRFLEVNTAFEAQTGMRDVVGKRMREFAPSHEEHWFELYGRIARTGESAHVLQEAHALGRYYDVRAYRIGDLNPGRVAIVFNDISERIRSERHLRQLNRVYTVLSDVNQTIVREKDSRAMMAAACRTAVEKGDFRMAWIGMVDAETQFVIPIASSGIENGYLGRVIIDLRDHSCGSGPAARGIRTGEHAICNDIEQDLDRPWRECALQQGYRSMAAFPLRSGDEVIGVFVLYASEPGFFDEDETKLLDEMAMDISYALEVNRREEEREKGEEELRWRTAFFEAQVEASIDGVLVVDSHGKKILQNRRLNELLDLPQHIANDPDDAAQLEFVANLTKAPSEFLEKVRYLMDHPEEVSQEEIELHNGMLLERYSSPVKDKQQRHYGRIWRFHDITEQRQLEAQFRQAQKMEAVGQLTGGIAHDFNNLLTVIKGCSEVIGCEATGNTRLSKLAGMISGAAQRGAELTHRMLAFGRRQTLQPKAVNVHELLASMEGFLRRTLSADIELEVCHRCADCTAQVDPTQLESALLNLCVNARDAMPNGGHLTLESSNAQFDSEYAAQNPDVEAGDYILIAVSDTGCGILPEDLEHVFEPFFTTKEVGKGSGLGLSMVYGFAKQSHGHVKVYSEPGRGTSVKLYLPKANSTSSQLAPHQEPIGDYRGSEMILLVEDNAAVREFAKSQLVELGYSVLEAANGQEALKKVSEHVEIDLLFTDMIMPGGMNGRELAAEASRVHPALKVLYCSGYAESAVVHQGLAVESIHLLNKPYSRIELASRIRAALVES